MFIDGLQLVFGCLLIWFEFECEEGMRRLARLIGHGLGVFVIGYS